MNILYRAHFGRMIGKDGLVTQEQVNNFLEHFVSPRFSGFTYIPVQGYWQGKPENSFILEFLCDSDKSQELELIATEYCKLFKQDAVLWYKTEIGAMEFTTSKTLVAFS